MFKNEPSNSKVIWITGASSGIGEGLAYAFAKKGHKLILSGRNVEALEKVKNNCHHAEIAILPFDITNIEDASENVARAISRFGTIDILINNAGISQRSLIAETPIDIDIKLMQIDYFGTIALTKALLPHFLERKKGQFVVISSLMGKFGSPHRSGYCASKHALQGYFDVLRMEHEKDNIDVTIICPGFINTHAAKNAIKADGTSQNSNDKTTEKGMPVSVFAQKAIQAIEKKKFEVYIGGKEVLGIYLKRFFPTFLHHMVLRSKVK